MIKHVLKTLVAVLAIATAAAGPARAQSNPTKYTSAVAMSALQVGDTLAEGFSLTGNDANTIYLVENRHKNNENLFGSQESINLEWIQSIGANCVFSTHPYNEDYTTTFAPVDENGRDGDAWVVTEVENIAGFTYLTIAGIRIPGPLHTVTFAEGTEDAANWTVTPAEALTTGIMSGSQLTATYAGDLKVKEVIATKHLEPNEVPLTIEALTAGTVVVHNPQSGMQYTLNGGAKTAVTSNINVAAGDKVAFYGNGTSITSYFGTQISGGTADVKAYGNIMSLVDENGFATATTLTANAAFNYLFSEYANLKDISGLLLPATTLTESCYATMFYNCTGLTTVPSDLLPATTLASRCYVGMFGSCENLTNVPTLPATTLAELCYNNMFLACNGLTTVPTDLLPATTLAPSCYSYMFLNCSNLTTAPALPATTLAEKCYQSMFANCTTLAASPVLPATTLAEKCYQQMFYDCENLATVPDTLPATTLASYCYQQMFYGCENLAASPVLPATTLVSYCYQQMFYDCSNLSSVTCLATSGINQNSSTEYWLERAGGAVQGTKTVNAASSANWPMDNDNGIPSDWTLVTPAHTPLTMEALTDGTIEVNMSGSGTLSTGMKYAVNGGEKTTITTTTTITVAAGDKVQFYGNGTSTTEYGNNPEVKLQGTAETKVYGNIMSLLDETGYETATAISGNYVFYALFRNNANLKDASGLLLPAMTLANDCYSNMFHDCSSLTEAPVLPAPTLVSGCYNAMFYNCRKLNSVTCLATSGINASSSTSYWLEGAGTDQSVTTKTFNAVSTATWPEDNVNGIPSGWTRQNIDN